MTDLPINPAGNLDLQALQQRRKQVLTVGVVLWVLLLLFTKSHWDTAPTIRAAIAGVGLLAILVCIMGRTWCTLYIGGLKKRELVTAGPYSLVRNPLYVFSAIGAAGIGAQTGSALLALLFAAGALAVFQVVARHEERFLAATFPADFAAYAARVPRFWPRLSQWREADELRVKPRLVRRTFFEACLFLLALPAAQFVTWLQQLGLLPVLLHLP
jgi:protein-S-isoprenylcysteine O-methyltransferase Ste14